MITNDAGEVAIRYYQSTGKHILLGNGHEYLFITHANVCISWVKPEDVDKVLDITQQCCGGNRNHIFSLATQQQVNLWTGQGDVRPTVNV